MPKPRQTKPKRAVKAKPAESIVRLVQPLTDAANDLYPQLREIMAAASSREIPVVLVDETDVAS